MNGRASMLRVGMLLGIQPFLLSGGVRARVREKGLSDIVRSLFRPYG